MKISQKRKKNRLILTVMILLTLAGCTGILFISSTRKAAMDELLKCENEIEVKRVWETYKTEQINDVEFEQELKNKLISFDLSQEKINHCLTWLPPTNRPVNIVVVSDLSQRIIDTANYPGQAERDTQILRSIWKDFIALTGSRETKNQLIFALTDGTRMYGSIQKKIDNLFVNMDGIENNPDHYFFTPYRTTKFNRNSRELYELANDNPLKKDFYTFFKSNLQPYLKAATLNDNYTNKVIILTDGFISQDTGGGTTAITAFEKEFAEASNRDSILECITRNGLNLRPLSTDFSNTEIMICEINGGLQEPPYYTEVISVYWKDWFNRMGCEIEITQSSLPPTLVCIAIRDFINK